MIVQVNNKEVEVAPGSTLAQAIGQLDLPTAGIAIAVDSKIVPRTEWEAFPLYEGAKLVIIKAACGG